MSVRKFWVAGSPVAAVQYTAETMQDALQPEGIVRKDTDNSVVDPQHLTLSMLRALRVASLCNMATCVARKILLRSPADT